MERADGEWCTLEMNKVAFLPRETRELCLGRGPLACLLLRTVRVRLRNLRVACCGWARGRATWKGQAGDEWLSGRYPGR